MTQQIDDIERRTKDILSNLSKDERVLLKKVIEEEKERIHMKTPHGIYNAIKESVTNIIR